jgi:hypothetical protein
MDTIATNTSELKKQKARAFFVLFLCLSHVALLNKFLTVGMAGAEENWYQRHVEFM